MQLGINICVYLCSSVVSYLEIHFSDRLLMQQLLAELAEIVAPMLKALVLVEAGTCR